MRSLIRRALSLARSNPRLFFRRLGMIARHPRRGIWALLYIPEERGRVQSSYHSWLEAVAAHPAKARIASSTDLTISILMPVFNTEERLLRTTLDSVLAQTDPHWELCIADDCSTAAHISGVLEEYQQKDNRIKTASRSERGHIAAASNSALEMANGEFVVLLDHDDLLVPDAIRQVRTTLSQDPRIDFAYSDEDKVDTTGNRTEPFFKPAWSPTLLASCNYITHLAAIRRSLLIDVGGFRPQMAGSQDWDVFLRVAERARAIAHIPCVLYSWRMSPTSTAGASTNKPYARDAARRSVTEALTRLGRPAEVHDAHLNGLFSVRYPLSSPPARVSLIVQGDSRRWKALLKTPQVEVCDVVHLDGPSPQQAGYRVKDRIDCLDGEYLFWVDSASRPAHPDSLLRLLEFLALDRIAVCGGSTYLGPRAVLQAGLVVGNRGQPRYAFAGVPNLPQPNFYLNLKDLPHEVSALSPACCAIRRETWVALQGFRADLPLPLAMTDLCLRARARGYDNLYTPAAQFRRRSPLPDLPSVSSYDWAWTAYRDPYWNPNLSPDSGDGLPFRWDPANAQPQISLLPSE